MDMVMKENADEKKVDHVPFSTHVPRDLMQRWQAVTEANEYRKKKLTRKLVRMFVEWSPEEQEAFYDAPESGSGLVEMIEDHCRRIVDERIATLQKEK